MRCRVKNRNKAYFVLDPRGYRGHALRKVLDLDQPFILEVRPASGGNLFFALKPDAQNAGLLAEFEGGAAPEPVPGRSGQL